MPGKQNLRGFTLIELIVVIMLLAIISVAAALRMAERGSFDAHLNRDQAISIARQVQIMAMNQPINSATDANASCYTLKISSDYLGSPRCDTVLPGMPPALTTADNNLHLSAEGLAVKNLYFDMLGRPFYFEGKGESEKRKQACDATSGCKLIFRSMSDKQATMCINQEGFIYADC